MYKHLDIRLANRDDDAWPPCNHSTTTPRTLFSVCLCTFFYDIDDRFTRQFMHTVAMGHTNNFFLLITKVPTPCREWLAICVYPQMC